MGKIIILDENTANKIAAGEVIERPASVIKELVENSIDAGATNISAEIRNGGVSFIRIIDNGCGIAPDDAEIAFERHATSKIRKADDLESISSMGFRGEALASIAAVSDVLMLTKVREKVQGLSIHARGGVINEIKPAGCPVGTSITVRELFFNTPARYKFLKKDSTEAGHAADVLGRVALGYPDISFRLVSNGTDVMHTPGNRDLKSAIFSVYGAETAKRLIGVDYKDDLIKIYGYVGKAEIARSNRNHQSFYINRRYIKSKSITAAIDAAYSTFLMKNKYAFALLDIRLNPSLVDVNVHPSKMEVKFSCEQDVYRAVYHAVNGALMSHSSVRTLPGSDGAGKTFYSFDSGPRQKQAPVFTQESFEQIRNELDRKRAEAISGAGGAGERGSEGGSGAVGGERGEGSIGAGEEAARAAGSAGDGDGPVGSGGGFGADANEAAGARGGGAAVSGDGREAAGGASGEAAEDGKSGPPETGRRDMQPGTGQDAGNAAADTISYNAAENAAENFADNATDYAAGIKTPQKLFNNYKIIGQAFSTYIFVEQGDEIYLIDQHAAHERIRYEELKKAYEKNESFSQTLMAVIPVELTGGEYQFAINEMPFFEKLGFTYDSFGTNSILLRSVPFKDNSGGVREMFQEILDFIINGYNDQRSLITDEALYRIACRSAVKANKKLDALEIKALLEKLSELDNPYTCPHGRPTILKLSKYELEKLFKRIV